MSINLRQLPSGEMDELGPGETRRLNHTDCPAGEDTRRRLYITRPQADPTKVIGYCHNCQDSGFMDDSQYTMYRDQRHNNSIKAEKIDKVKDVIIPHQLIAQRKDWPIPAQAWAIQNGITQNLAFAYGIAFDPSTDRVYLPRYRYWDYYGNGKQLIGYQLRDVVGHGSKYLTVQQTESEPWSVIVPKDRTNYGVIVEDLCSGIHIAQATMATRSNPPHIYINYGVKIQNHMLWHMRNLAHIQVWLDNDSPHVERQADHIARTAGLFAPEAQLSIVRRVADPKHLHHNSEEIIRTMDDAWTT